MEKSDGGSRPGPLSGLENKYVYLFPNTVNNKRYGGRYYFWLAGSLVGVLPVPTLAYPLHFATCVPTQTRSLVRSLQGTAFAFCNLRTNRNTQPPNAPGMNLAFCNQRARLCVCDGIDLA